jgi:hypothetical protein
VRFLPCPELSRLQCSDHYHVLDERVCRQYWDWLSQWPRDGYQLQTFRYLRLCRMIGVIWIVEGLVRVLRLARKSTPAGVSMVNELPHVLRAAAGHILQRDI